MTSDDDRDMIPLAQQRKRTFDRPTLILPTMPKGQRRMSVQRLSAGGQN